MAALHHVVHAHQHALWTKDTAVCISHGMLVDCELVFYSTLLGPRQLTAGGPSVPCLLCVADVHPKSGEDAHRGGGCSDRVGVAADVTYDVGIWLRLYHQQHA